jgi:putative CocE/NonD family hydrolase
VLYVETSAPNTDFTAQLLYVEPDGRTFNITEGIVRREFRQDSEPQRISIELWPTSIVLEAGRRLRLDIASSNYPRWDANPNTGRDPARETAPVSATQRIFWGGATPSYITLPLIPTSPPLTEETPR